MGLQEILGVMLAVLNCGETWDLSFSDRDGGYPVTVE